MGLSPDEERHIQNLALIPFALIFYLCLGYFVYLVHINAELSLSFIVAYFTTLFLIVFPLVYFTTLQVLRSRSEKRPLAYYAKQFLGSILIWVVGAVIFGVVWFVVSLSLSSILDGSTLVITTYAIFVGIWGFVVFRFREEFSSLSKGDW